MSSSRHAALDEFDDDDDETVADLVSRTAQAKSDSKKGPGVLAMKRKRDVDDSQEVGIARKKRAVTTLTPLLLLGKMGLDNLKGRFETFRPRSVKEPGYELNDLSRLLHIYRSWAENLGAREGGNWADFVDKLDRLKKNDIRKYLAQMRFGQDSTTTVSIPEVPAATPVNDEMSIPRAEPVSVPKDTTVRPTAIPAISEELRRRIEEKKLEALRRRQDRERAQQAEVNVTAFSQMPTQDVNAEDAYGTQSQEQNQVEMDLTAQAGLADVVPSVPAELVNMDGPTQVLSAQVEGVF